ncbi:hypothetical protein [Streptomyces sp. NBC_00388]|uniref:hypothetical protein n=1 Tax=Streptomyces sp. NBC_00388 TaxID=2975735 RepID=UPI002E1AF856
MAGGREPADDRESEDSPESVSHLSVVLIDALHQASMRALAYAASLQQPVLALHVSAGDEDAERFREGWLLWGTTFRCGS